MINEIGYHPASENTGEEFIELFNPDAIAVDAGGWKFTSGVDFTIPSGTLIPAGGYLVVAADAEEFLAVHPEVTSFVAGWTGILSNSSNRIRLADALGNVVDDVRYADDGDWGIRRKDWWSSYGHKGLAWDSAADGKNDPPPYSNAPADVLGKNRSLELINPDFDNSTGQNWATSVSAGGTPGSANSVSAADIAPVILDASHFPAVPKSTEPVSVTATILDDHGAAISASVFWRTDGSPSFTEVAMADDGEHGDGLAGDGVFGASLPVQPNGTIVEFYLAAGDGALTRTWPAPVSGDDANLTPAQSANCLYQADDTVYAGSMPIYRIIMKAADKTELAGINANGTGGSHPYPFYSGETNDQTMSHARFNASFVAVDGTGTSVRYRAGVRNRGNGSRDNQPQGLNIMFPNDDPWSGISQLNLNTQYTPNQLFGAALFAKSNVPAPQSRAVQVRWNSVNPEAAGGSPSYGFVACNEAWNSDLIDRRFPTDSSGNLYKSMRIFQGTTSGGTSIPNGGELNHIVPGPTETKSLVDLYKLNYKKQTNTSEDDWTDLITLTAALAKGHSGTNYTDPVTWDADYAAAVRSVADVEEWMRWFAVNTMVDNCETNLSNGDGDDFNFYIGANDPRCKLMPYDLDTILGGGDTAGSATASIYRMLARNSSTSPNAPTPMNAFIKHPEFAPLYYAALKDLLDGPFKPSNFASLAQQTLGGLVNQSVIESMKTFNSGRTTYVASQIPLAISVTTAPAVSNGYPRSTTATTTLGGKANAITTRSVKVNGTPATWTAFGATWTATGVNLTPGINRVLIQSFDSAGTETSRSLYDVWYDDSTVATASGTLASDTTWTAADGPYSVTSSLTVPAGVTLTIEPGTTVYMGSGVNLTVANGGRIIAEGTVAQPIRFSRTPGATTTWGGITINGSTSGSSPLTVIRNTFFEFNGSTAIHTQSGAEVELEGLSFGTTSVQYLSLDASSFVVRDCHFPDSAAGSYFEMIHGTGGIKAGGRGIFARNYVGVANSVSGDYNDSFDFTGGQRPGPILEVIDNVFAGSGDDLIDLDGTDTWIEGNIFMHVHKNGSPDSASAISGGSDSGDVSRVTIIGNLFFDMDHAATAKQGNYYTFINNTVVRQTISGGNDSEGGVFNFADDGTTAGAGMFADSNILVDCTQLLRNYDAGQTAVTLSNNLMPFNWTGPGGGNSTAPALLVHQPTVAEAAFTTWAAAQVMKSWFALQPISPAIGTGPNGSNLGGAIPTGASLLADVPQTTHLTTINVSVGAQPPLSPPWLSGYTHYRWRLDGGVWSAETAIATPITIANLTDGAHLLEVVGKNDGGIWQDDPALGASASLASFAWTVDTSIIPPGPAPLVILSEVLARNSESYPVGGAFPDVIELYNAGDAPADLSGWGLSDDTALPYRYSFPQGTTLAAGAYLVVHATGTLGFPEPRTGFGLGDEGEVLTLSRPLAEGGGVADTVTFGHQLSDYSIGRVGQSGEWALCLPTPGAANAVAAHDGPGGLKINEWLASSAVTSATDFIEIFNPGALPVDAGECYLTDNPGAWPNRHLLAPLTFVGASGYCLFKADGDTNQGPDHLSFKLDAAQGEVGLLDPELALLDSAVYGPQTTDVSQGRTPNGAAEIAFFNQPTPGGPNPGTTTASGTTTVNLIPVNASWKYMASSSTAYQSTYHTVEFDDSAWPSGGQLLHYETSSVTSASGFAKTTQMARGSNNYPYPTYYFRRPFTYNGPSTDIVLKATTMVDDAALIYINGQLAQNIRMTLPVSYTSTGGGAVGSGTEAAEEVWVLPANLLVQGDNVIAVEVHQVNNTSSDVVMGLKLDVEITSTLPAAQVVINEVLAKNATLTNPDSSLAGWIELHNPDTTEADISDMSLSQSVAAPRAWVAPAGTVIPAGGHLVIQCDPLLPASAVNTGFSLDPVGGSLHLFHASAIGGGLRDSVTWGNQLADLSIGRVPNGSGAFSLNIPSRGALNIGAATGSPLSVRVNEWLASPTAGPDWFELFNTDPLPVALGGNYLTDSLTNKTKQIVTPLTFIGGNGWLTFVADGNSTLPGHVNFALSSAGEALGLFSAAGYQYTAIGFGAQAAGVSQGAYPDGTSTITNLVPTPGAANAVPNPDVDSDGLPDEWELANGLDPNNPADALADSDGDGSNNKSEYLAGTDPQDPGSRLAATLQTTGSGMTVRFIAQPGRSYTVQYSSTLQTADWQKLTDIAPVATATEVSVNDPASESAPVRFYRVVTPAQP
ncbi:MAG: lamin tail domain-containing protein [Verrucomicrobia bacterium]|nr:lamin tail domain-containing protein [Verrucomicrobiota bacterium]